MTFHLAENKRDPDYPFAFLATYANRLSAQGKVQHEPLGRALQQYAGAQNRAALLSLLLPIQRAAERSAFAKDSSIPGRSITRWRGRRGRRTGSSRRSRLRIERPDRPGARLVERPNRPPRPVVSVKVDDEERRRARRRCAAGFLRRRQPGRRDAQPRTRSPAVLESTGGLVPLKGKWVEVDREKLSEALEHWKQVERDVRGGGISFFEGMRLLSGANLGRDDADDEPGGDPRVVGPDGRAGAGGDPRRAARPRTPAPSRRRPI